MDFRQDLIRPVQQGAAKMKVKGAVLVLFNEFQSCHRRPLWVVHGIGRMHVFRVDVLRPGKAQRFEVTTHPAFVVFELSRSFRSRDSRLWEC